MTDSHSSRELSALLDAAVDGIIIIDHLGTIRSFNRAAERMFGFTSDEVLGTNVSVLMNDEDSKAHDGHLARYVDTRVPHIIGRGRDVTVRRKDGSLFPAHLSVGVIAGEDPPRFVGLVHDITQSRRMEAESHQLQDRLTHVSRLATVGEMASGIAHELNQPLAAMATYAHACDRLLALPEPDIEEVSSALKLIADQAVRAGDIIRRMRALARSEETARTLVDVNTLIDELATLMNSDAKAHGVQFRQDLAPDLPAISANGAQIQQVVINLVRNALEALAPARCAPAQSEVVVATRRTPEGHVEISISDNGPGVPDSLKERIFDPFCTTKASGTGLGLAISRTIIAAHEGTLEYEPNQPSGARFTIRFIPDRMEST
ncbi:MAG: PAS domain S-box protein [Proteobacteria bacterium]|nr:PAS domain S-box protein [Pseudomonadota bacterium]